MKNLKQHVESIMQKGTAAEQLKKSGNIKDTFKIAPISNAFSLDIKNQREEALKNMEHLRQSVKLKKRANPLEKIVSKLMHNEQVREMTSKTEPAITSIKEEAKKEKEDIQAKLPKQARQNIAITIGQL